MPHYILAVNLSPDGLHFNRVGGDRDNADTADKDAPQLVLQPYSTAFLRAEISVDLIPLVFPSH